MFPFGWSNPPVTTPDETEAPDAPSALQAARAAAAAERATTRSHSTSSSHLQLPTNSTFGAQHQIRSRTPSPRHQDDDRFHFNAIMDEETVARITREAVAHALALDRTERDNQQRIATQAAVAAALTNQQSQVQSLRRPELPTFDKRNILIWIKRVESSYMVSNVTNSKFKFAYLEKSFSVDSDPEINSYLYGDRTDADWENFLKYLIDLYGRTKRQQAYSVINGTPREDRRPSVLFKLMQERAGEITLDDIYKEQLLKEMPQQVQIHVSSMIEGQTATETAKLLDSFFDKDGKLLHAGTPSTVHSISNSRPPPAPAASASASASFTSAFAAEEETDVNAVRFKDGKEQRFNISNRSSSAPRGRGSFNGRFQRSSSSGVSNGNSYGDSSSYAGNRDAPGQSKGQICRFHVKFGEKAERCESWCILKGKFPPPKGKANH